MAYRRTRLAEEKTKVEGCPQEEIRVEGQVEVKRPAEVGRQGVVEEQLEAEGRLEEEQPAVEARLEEERGAVHPQAQ